MLTCLSLVCWVEKRGSASWEGEWNCSVPRRPRASRLYHVLKVFICSHGYQLESCQLDSSFLFSTLHFFPLKRFWLTEGLHACFRFCLEEKSGSRQSKRDGVGDCWKTGSEGQRSKLCLPCPHTNPNISGPKPIRIRNREEMLERSTYQAGSQPSVWLRGPTRHPSVLYVEVSGLWPHANRCSWSSPRRSPRGERSKLGEVKAGCDMTCLC